MKSHLLFAPLCALLLLLSPSARGDAGHDHGEAPSTPSGPALPRFAAVSESFELVGVLSGRQLTLYLDRFASNEPVPGATLELDVGGKRVEATPHGEGEFEARLDDEPPPGVLPVTATVVAGAQSDLLVGELDIHGDHHAATAAPPNLRLVVGWALGAVAILALLAWRVRRAASARAARTRGVA